MLQCDCGWKFSWGEYFETIQHKQLSGVEPVIQLMQAFVQQFPSAHSAREKVLSIDQLIHGFHWYVKKTHSATRPVAINLLEGKLHEVIEFLDSLTYSEKSTPGMRSTKAEWDKNITNARRWGQEQK